MGKCKPSHLTVYIIIAFVLVAIMGIIAMKESSDIVSMENDLLAEQITALEQQNLEYEERIANLGTDESVEQLARERLHWVYDREIVYINSGAD